MKITDPEVRKDFPTNLGEVLTCSTSVMSTTAKVVLIALVFRWTKDKDTRSLPVRLPDLAMALGEHHSAIFEAARELHRMDYLDLEGKSVRLIKNHSALKPGSFFSIPGLKLDRIPEFVAEGGKLKDPPKVTPEATGTELDPQAIQPAGPLGESKDPPKVSKKKSSKKASSKRA